jgi:hypothetical protein
MPNAYSAMKALLEYSRSFHRQDLDALELSELYDLHPDPKNPRAPSWPAPFPNSDRAGVYMFFDDKLNLLYVGKASMNNNLGNRVGAYFKYADDKTCLTRHEWSAPLKYVATIAVPDNATFEAPALEEYLITRLNPPDNTHGRTDGHPAGS